MIANRKNSVKTIMMTSAQPGDGKSTTISNLAIALAQAGKRILLIDADMRRPVISKMFGIEHSTGLSDFLLGEADLAEASAASDVAGLDVMPNGSATGEPAELLESIRMRQLLKQASDAYDLVLIDAPPLLAVTDPAIIGPCVDSVLLTVRILKNGRRAVEDAVRVLQDINVTPTAVLVNGVDNAVRTSYMHGTYNKSGYGYVGRYHDRYSADDSGQRTGQVKATSSHAHAMDSGDVVRPHHRDQRATSGINSDASNEATARTRRPGEKGIGFPSIDSTTHSVSQR